MQHSKVCTWKPSMEMTSQKASQTTPNIVAQQKEGADLTCSVHDRSWRASCNCYCPCSAQLSVFAEQGNALAGPRWVNAAGGHPAHQLLKKLRWCTLGPQFDWTARVYDRHAAYSPLPEELRALALRLCASAAPSLPNLTAGVLYGIDSMGVPRVQEQQAYAQGLSHAIRTCPHTCC